MKYLTYVSLLLCFCSATKAQMSEAPSDTIVNELDWAEEISTVVVTGTRTPKLLKDTPILTKVLTEKDIRNADATNIMDLLQTEIPGVEFTYAMNQQVNMNLSGFSGQGILILVDGEVLAGETMDNIDFTRISMADVERIEIVRSAASALYGSNAAGGVINIITKKADRPWTLHLDGRYGHHNEQRYNVYHSLKQGIYSHNISFVCTASDNYSVTNKDDKAVARTFSEVYGDKTWNAKYGVSIDIHPKLKLSGRVGYFRRTVDRTADTPERYHDYTAGVKGEWNITQQDKIELSYAFDQYDKSKYQRVRELDIREYSNVKNSTRILYNHNSTRGDVLTIGADYLYDYLMSNNIEKPVHQQNVDAFAQYDWKTSDKWELVGALRYDYFSQQDISRVTPKLSACWRPATRWTLRASYGMGFRAPTLKERYHVFDMAGIWIVEGNKNLKSESSHNVTLSGEYTIRNWNITLSAYYNRIYNRITTGTPYYKPNDDKQLYLAYVNLGNMNVYGVEASVTARWRCGLGMKLCYAFSHEDVSDKTLNPYMPARPHSLTARVDWDKQFSDLWGLNVALSGRTMSGIDNTEYINMYDISEGTREVSYSGYSIWKLQAAVRFRQWCKLQATIDNIFNYRPDYYYYNAPLTTGINFLVGLSLDIDKICAKR